MCTVPVRILGNDYPGMGTVVKFSKCGKMLADVGMVKTYSKSVHVNDLGFVWTGPPCCMDRLAPLFAWTGPPPRPCSYGYSARWFYLAGTHCTIPTSALVFGGNIFTHPCFYTFYGMQTTHGPVNF